MQEQCLQGAPVDLKASTEVAGCLWLVAGTQVSPDGFRI